MEDSNYVIKTNEAVLMPTKVNKGKIVLRNCIWIVISIVFIGSFLFGINLFSEFSWTTRILLILLVVRFGFYSGEKEYMPSPTELHFYDDYLVLYLPRRYYSSRVTRKQINTMNYNEISKCVYKTKSNRIQIYGDGKSIWYNYNKDGSIPKKPTEERCFSQGMIYFDTQLSTDINFKNEIENHSPLQVIIENS